MPGSLVPEIDWDELKALALDATTRAYAPYSHLQVGAAAVVDDGRIVTGCNVENASYGLGLCAECGLVSDLAGTGGGHLVAVAVVNGSGEALAPCGRCRQLLYEHGGAACLVMGDDRIATVGDLLPGAFGPEDLPT